jgi:hypothetical protein
VNLSQTNSEDVFAFGAVLATDGAGNIHAAWTRVDINANEEEIRLSTSADGGRTFSSSVNVSRTHPFGVTGTAAMAIDEQGNISVVWGDISTSNFEIFYSQSTNGGRSFSVPVNISNNVGLSGRPDIAVGSDGRTAIIWDDDQDGIGNVFLSLTSGL